MVKATKKRHSFFTRFVVTLLLMICVFVTALAITYFRKMFVFAAPKTYQECIAKKSSKIQESYPSVCISKEGQKFIQPLSEEELKLLESPLKQGEKQKDGKFCGGIAAIPCDLGYKCQLEGAFPDAGGKCIKE